MIERDIRKSVFLREAGRQLPNVAVATNQFEEVPDDFEWLISRAVNLAAIQAGPRPKHAAVLGGASIGESAGLIASYKWRKVALPWEKGGFLWLGDQARDVSRETWFLAAYGK